MLTLVHLYKKNNLRKVWRYQRGDQKP